MEQEFYSTTEVAAIFDVSTYTVRRWIKQGKFGPVNRDGESGRRKVPAAAVKELAQERFGNDKPIVGI